MEGGSEDGESIPIAGTPKSPNVVRTGGVTLLSSTAFFACLRGTGIQSLERVFGGQTQVPESFCDDKQQVGDPPEESAVVKLPKTLGPHAKTNNNKCLHKDCNFRERIGPIIPMLCCCNKFNAMSDADRAPEH